MDKLHYKTLASAVVKYGDVEGTEEDVKSAIAADEKEFTPEQVEEIYQAIINPEVKSRGEKKAYIVVKEFRDISDFMKRYYVGDDVSHFDAKRLERLVNLGIVEIQSSLK